MSKIIGRQISAGLGVEKVRGTGQLTAEKWVKKTSAYIVDKTEKVIEDSTCGAVLEDSFNRRVIKKWVEGSLEGIVQADAIGYALYNIFGTVNTTGSTVYTHAFSLLQSILHPMLTVFIKNGDIEQYAYAGGMIGSLNISASMDDYVRYTANFMAKSGVANTDTVECDTEYDFIGKDITIKLADTEAGLSGATAVKIKAVDITFDQGLINDFCFGSYTPDDINNGKLSIEGSFTKNFIDTVYKTLNGNDSAKYMQIVIEGGTTIGSGSDKPTLTILMNKVMITDWAISGGSDELVEETVSFKAFYNKTDTEACTVTLKNLTQEYSVPVSD